MKRNKKRGLVAVLAICALAAGGAAFTADIGGAPGNPVIAGFHQTTISGATASNVTWNISADGQYVSSVVMTLKQDAAGTTPGAALPAGTKISVGFGSDPLSSLYSCPDGDGTTTTFTCDLSSDNVPVTDANVFNVSVTDNTTAKVS